MNSAQASESNLLLASLPAEDLAYLLAQGRAVPLVAGTILHDMESDGPYVYFIRHGVVSVLVTMDDGQAAEIALVGPEGFVGWTSVFSRATLPTQAIIVVPGTAFRVPAARLRAALESRLGILNVISRYQAALTSQAQLLVACGILHGLEQRLCRWLLDIAERSNAQHIFVTQEALAQTLGVHRASVHETLMNLRQSGAIKESRRGEIEIADPERLAALACECCSVMRRIYKPL